MRPPISGALLITQGFASLKGGPSERYTAWREGKQITCLGHPAYDLNCVIGTPVVAVKPGIVAVTFGDQFFGNYIVLTVDGTGETYTYAHLSTVEVGTGQHVNDGQQIALSGNTGNSTGPHLHFAYRPSHPNFNNGFDGYESWITHLDAYAYPHIDLSLV